MRIFFKSAIEKKGKKTNFNQDEEKINTKCFEYLHDFVYDMFGEFMTAVYFEEISFQVHYALHLSISRFLSS